MKLSKTELVFAIILFTALGAAAGAIAAEQWSERITLTLEQTEPYRMPLDCSYVRGEC